MLWARAKGINKWNKHCRYPVCCLSAIWNCKQKMWLVLKWACKVDLAGSCYAKHETHMSGLLQSDTAPAKPVGPNNCAAVCMQEDAMLGLHVLICMQLHTSNFALILFLLKQRKLSSLFHICCKCKVACYLCMLVGSWPVANKQIIYFMSPFLLKDASHLVQQHCFIIVLHLSFTLV